MKRSIVWFKTDLRLQDNEALVKAIESSDEIIPIYVIDPRQFVLSEFGFKKTGQFRARFLLETLEDLKKSLGELGSDLLILKGKPEEEIPIQVKKYGVKTIFTKKEVAYEELQVQCEVETECWKLNCAVEVLSTSTLFHAVDLPFGLKDIPDVFSNFRKKVEHETPIRKVYQKPSRINSPIITFSKVPSLSDFEFVEFIVDDRRVLAFKGGENEALTRLNYYLFDSGKISNYKETRNGLIGEGYSTKLAPWLALGCISARTIYWELKRYEEEKGANESTYWLFFELQWRDYFRFMMKKHREKFFRLSGIKEPSKVLVKDDRSLLQKWIDGKTGDRFVDANMIELKQTGFISNRGRQNVASFLIDQMNLDWRYGAAYFEQQLIDYDACSNWGNWAYLAGVGNDPRGKRIFDTEKQAKDYDPKNQYRNLWLTNKNQN